MSEIDPHDYEYVVMSEAQGRHYVVVRRKSGSVWLQVVASFSDRDRAVMYADLENMIHEDRVVDPTDPPRADQDIYAEPPGHEVASGLPGLVEVIRSVTVTG
ncbi:MAG TPA: hypothetical protein VM434_18520, partial [Beijerinckiaceae bacterium]|nr:hypothetical protein [Beijerinckiaceae bacterium]